MRYRELLEELRTIIPGAQVLLAFLLTVPFAARFSDVNGIGKVVFTASLMAVTGATILFTAPAAYHRLADRRDRSGRLLFDSTALGSALAGATAVAATIAWYALPVQARRRSGGIPESQSGPGYPE